MLHNTKWHKPNDKYSLLSVSFSFVILFPQIRELCVPFGIVCYDFFPMFYVCLLSHFIWIDHMHRHWNNETYVSHGPIVPRRIETWREKKNENCQRTNWNDDTSHAPEWILFYAIHHQIESKVDRERERQAESHPDCQNFHVPFNFVLLQIFLNICHSIKYINSMGKRQTSHESLIIIQMCLLFISLQLMPLYWEKIRLESPIGPDSHSLRRVSKRSSPFIFWLNF